MTSPSRLRHLLSPILCFTLLSSSLDASGRQECGDGARAGRQFTGRARVEGQAGAAAAGRSFCRGAEPRRRTPANTRSAAHASRSRLHNALAP